MSSASTERLELENDLRRAIERDELRLHYQPLVDLATGHDRRARGPRPLAAPGPRPRAADVVHPAGRGDRAHPADRPVGARDGLPPGPRLAASRSPPRPRSSCRSTSRPASSPSPAWPRDVAAILAETGLDPASLELEITESVLMDDSEAGTRSLRALHELGVRSPSTTSGPATRRSSYLKQLPLDAIKIDRSFVAELDRGRRHDAPDRRGRRRPRPRARDRRRRRGDRDGRAARLAASPLVRPGPGLLPRSADAGRRARDPPRRRSAPAGPRDRRAQGPGAPAGRAATPRGLSAPGGPVRPAVG